MLLAFASAFMGADNFALFLEHAETYRFLVFFDFLKFTHISAGYIPTITFTAVPTEGVTLWICFIMEIARRLTLNPSTLNHIS